MVKATRLLTANLPRVKEYILSFSSQHFRLATVQVRTIEENGLFSTAKLKPYPARLNASILLSFVDRFAKCSAVRGSADEYLDKAFGVLLGRCVEVETQAHLGLAFNDSIAPPFDDQQHPLASLAEWPDRDSGVGKGIAF